MDREMPQEKGRSEFWRLEGGLAISHKKRNVPQVVGAEQGLGS
jgi:hypothetical protein